MSRSAASLSVQRHEALHAVATFVLLGVDFVGGISRRPDADSLGRTAIADLPDRPMSVKAFDKAVVTLTPVFDSRVDVDGCDDDVQHVFEDIAPIAWKYRVDHAVDVDEWLSDWMSTVGRRCRELLAESRTRHLVAALEHALDFRADMSAEDVRAVLRSADT
jgi:hypothetical protein